VPRWAKAGDVLPEPPAPAPVPAAEASPGRPAPTLEDVAQLTPDSDYSVFVGQGVDKSVQRLALKKLFADPHFNVLDRLDMYMDDYNKPSPVSAAMLASLDHARSALRRFVEDDPALAPASTPASAPAQAPALASAAGAADGEPAAPAAQHDVQYDAVAQHQVAHNEAAQAAAAHEASLAGDASCAACLPDAGLSDSPNPHMSQGPA
jgi:hypothetical protein